MTSVRQSGALACRIRAVLAIDPSANAIEFAGTWWSYAQLTEIAAAVSTQVPGMGAPVGILLRNTPAHVGALLGVLEADGCVVTINPSLGPERVAADLASLPLAALAGTTADLATYAADFAAAPRLVLDGQTGVEVVGEPAPPVEARPGVAVLMLTSGTTGPPKRVDLKADLLVRTFEGAKHYETKQADDLVLRKGVAVVNSPLVHLSGVFRVVQCVLDGRSFALLPRFEVNAWADAVRRHRAKTASLVPTALRMVLDSDVRPEDLASLLSITSGTAPLDPADAEAFHDRFGVPVLTSYAATEFGGGVAGWNIKDWREFGSTKRGSVGRAHAGCGLRVVTEEGVELAADEVGLLEVRPAQFGADAEWIRTTDLARIDADGFMWIVGRADQTIIRGGFKIQPDTVRSALEALPSVRYASVFGLPDERLGEIPVALVEVRAEATSAELLEEVAPHLASYEVPAVLRIVETLPRTASGKVDLTAARAFVRTEKEDA